MLSPGDAMRLQDPSDGHRSPAHCPVRAAHQPVQREDLHLPLVLDGLHRDDDLPQLPTLGLGALLPVHPRALHPEAPAHHEQTEPRRRSRHETVEKVHRALSSSGRNLRAEARRQELNGARGRRYRVGVVGQLRGQANEHQDRSRHGRQR